MKKKILYVFPIAILSFFVIPGITHAAYSISTDGSNIQFCAGADDSATIRLFDNPADVRIASYAGTEYGACASKTVASDGHYYLLQTNPLCDSGATYNFCTSGNGYTVVWTDEFWRDGGVYSLTDPDAPPAPDPSAAFMAMLDSSRAAFASTTGFTMAASVSWAGDNLIKPFAGAMFALLYSLRYWIIALIILGAIIFFSFRALKLRSH